MLWSQRYPMTIDEIRHALGAELDHATVAALMADLVERGFVRCGRDARADAYMATHD